MNRIEAMFQELVIREEKALVAYICAGDPSIDFTFEVVDVLIRKGVHMVELGIPFSDPLADGPTIQKASNRALEGGVKIEDIFTLVERIRQYSQIPLLFMGYYNTLYSYGVEDFVVHCKEVGLDGLIIPDLPPEEGRCLKEAATREDISSVFLLSPNSTKKRIEKVVAMASGFIYCVSVTGVTGAREGSFHQLKSLVSSLKSITSLPLLAGFGIKTGVQARELSALTHGIIVGSAFIDTIERHLEEIHKKEYGAALEEIASLVEELRGSL